MRINLLVIVSLFFVSNLAISQDDSIDSTDFQYIIKDCVIGEERQIGDQDTMMNGHACDSYWWDRYERPYSQVSESSDIPDYYCYVDIVECSCVDLNDGWIYCMIELFNGEDTENGDPLGDPGGPLNGQWYVFEFDTDCDWDGDYALAVSNPTTDDHRAGWTSKQTELHYDTDEDVGRPHTDPASPCFGNPDGCDPLHPDCPGPYCGDGGNQCSNITGYETEIAVEDANVAVSRVLQDQNLPIVQLAVKKSELGNMSCEFTYRAWAIRPFSPLGEMALHDKYLHNGFGSAHPDSCQYPIQNFYESDNCSGSEGFMGFHPPMPSDDIVLATGEALNIMVFMNDTDPDGNLDTTSTMVGGNCLMPVYGDVVVNPDGSVTYTPHTLGTYNGDSFEYLICDDGLPNQPLCAKATVTIHPIVLSVDLVGFDVSKKDCDVTIEWSTSTEINSSHFEINYSANGRDWEPLATIKSIGNSDRIQRYSYQHLDVSGASYYQLVEVDKNGTKKTYDAQFVRVECESDAILNVYPNPTNNNLFIELNADFEGVGVVSIYDVMGVEVKKILTQKRVGTWTVTSDLFSLPDGLYYVKASWGANREILPFVKL